MSYQDWRQCEQTWRTKRIWLLTCLESYVLFYGAFLSFFGTWQVIVTVHFHCVEKNSMNILKNISFVFHRKDEKWYNFQFCVCIWTLFLTYLVPKKVPFQSSISLGIRNIGFLCLQKKEREKKSFSFFLLPPKSSSSCTLFSSCLIRFKLIMNLDQIL